MNDATGTALRPQLASLDDTSTDKLRRRVPNHNAATGGKETTQAKPTRDG